MAICIVMSEALACRTEGIRCQHISLDYSYMLKLTPISARMVQLCESSPDHRYEE
jgi:hypothetical protein